VHLPINVVEWEGHQLESIKKLKEILDKEFKYVDNEFSTIRFKSMAKRLLKTKKSKLKTKFLGGKTYYPMNIKLTNWEKLKVY
jgi:hypothetical protein